MQSLEVPMNAVPWHLSQTDENGAFRLDYVYPGTRHAAGLALLSDVHFDNPDCDRARLKRFFDLAAAQGRPIICVGDWFCAMQGKQDKRQSKSKVEPYNGQSYLDRLVNDSFDFLRPYAHLLAVWGDGNHETAITNRMETDLLERLCHRLRAEAGSQVLKAPYQFWVSVRQRRATQGSREKKTASGAQYIICLRHSGGSRGVVSKGTLSANRMSVTYHGAHLYVSGDTHVQWMMTVPTISLDRWGTIRQTPAQHVKLGCWKDEHSGGGGWWNETDKDPITLGGAFVDITVSKDAVASHEIRHVSADPINGRLVRRHTKHYNGEDD